MRDPEGGSVAKAIIAKKEFYFRLSFSFLQIAPPPPHCSANVDTM